MQSLRRELLPRGISVSVLAHPFIAGISTRASDSTNTSMSPAAAAAAATESSTGTNSTSSSGSLGTNAAPPVVLRPAGW
jgi:hypothetical protein